MPRLALLFRLVSLTPLAIAAPALAQEQPALAQEQTPAPAPAAAPFAGAALGDDSLGRIAGREDTRQVALADQQATVTRNSVGDNVHTGDAKISDNAFQNLSGLSIVNVNTGNNVAINAAMNVTIAIQPAP